MSKIKAVRIDEVTGEFKEDVVLDKSQVLYETVETTDADGNTTTEEQPRQDIVYPTNKGYEEIKAEGVSIYIADVPEGTHSPKFDFTNEVFTEAKTDADLLLEAQLAKMSELEQKCQETILAGFDYTINTVSYHFSMSITAQSNFQETGDMFKEGAITSETWTVLNNSTGKIERIALDEVTFKGVRDVGRSLVRDNVSKLRDTLEPQVWSATSVADVEKIVW